MVAHVIQLVIQYDIGPKHAVMGSALHIPLPNTPAVGSKLKVTINYKTTEGCTALQWLDKEYATICCSAQHSHTEQ